MSYPLALLLLTPSDSRLLLRAWSIVLPFVAAPTGLGHEPGGSLGQVHGAGGAGPFLRQVNLIVADVVCPFCQKAKGLLALPRAPCVAQTLCFLLVFFFMNAGSSRGRSKAWGTTPRAPVSRMHLHCASPNWLIFAVLFFSKWDRSPCCVQQPRLAVSTPLASANVSNRRPSLHAQLTPYITCWKTERAVNSQRQGSTLGPLQASSSGYTRYGPSARCLSWPVYAYQPVGPIFVSGLRILGSAFSTGSVFPALLLVHCRLSVSLGICVPVVGVYGTCHGGRNFGRICLKEKYLNFLVQFITTKVSCLDYYV